VYPKEFEFEVKARGKAYVELVRGFERDHPWPESDAGLLGSVKPLKAEL
jgi:hypothetical protein